MGVHYYPWYKSSIMAVTVLWTMICRALLKHANIVIWRRWWWESNINVWVRFVYSHKLCSLVTVFPKQNYNVLSPISTFMNLWAIFIFPWSVYLFCCSQLGRLILGICKSLTDTWMWNWKRGCAVFLRIHKSDFRYSVIRTAKEKMKSLEGQGPNYIRVPRIRLKHFASIFYF